jgi:hypothetical protein
MSYGFWPRLGFYLVATTALTLLGGALACGCNLAAPLFGLPRGPWAELWHIGMRCGVVGGGMGGLWVFAP